MRRVLPVAVAAAALCFSQLPASTASVSVLDSAGVTRAAGPDQRVRTKFALNASAYGSRVDGGSVPANSRDTAYTRIGCTNVAGLDRVNFVADQNVPGLGKVEGVRTRVWTEKVGTTVSSYSRHSIAKVTIGNAQFGTLDLIGLSSTSQAFNKNGKFGTTVDNEIAKIQFTPPGAPAQQFEIPAPGQTLTIPGLAEISLGKSTRRVGSNFARVSATVVDVTVIPLETRARIAQTNAGIQGGIRQGVFQGYADGVEARALADNTRVGRTPLTIVPCRGTDGKTVGKDITAVDLGALGNLTGVASGARASNAPRVAQGTVAGRVAVASLFDGRVQVKGVIGVATVKRERGVLTRSDKGSTVLEIVIDGEPFTIPGIGKLEIPGLVRLEDDIRNNTKNGLKVIGLRVTALDGTGAVVDLGVAELGIRPGVKAVS